MSEHRKPPDYEKQQNRPVKALNSFIPHHPAKPSHRPRLPKTAPGFEPGVKNLQRTLNELRENAVSQANPFRMGKIVRPQLRMPTIQHEQRSRQIPLHDEQKGGERIGNFELLPGELVRQAEIQDAYARAIDISAEKYWQKFWKYSIAS
jgi:hypothetical protein